MPVSRHHMSENARSINNYYFIRMLARHYACYFSERAESLLTCVGSKAQVSAWQLPESTGTVLSLRQYAPASSPPTGGVRQAQ